MIDERFYDRVGAPTATEIAAVVGGVVLAGNASRCVRSLAAAGEAGPDDLAFVERDDAAAIAALGAGVALVPSYATPAAATDVTIVGVKHPRSAFLRAAGLIARLREAPGGTQAVHPDARIHASAVLEPGCVVGPGVAVGAGARVGAGAVLCPGVQVGQGSHIGARAVIRCALVGDGVIILSGAVIGENGFGVAAGASGAALAPHFGRVIIQNGVSIGANVTMDRGFLADTVIGEGTQIDNMCHIAHNVRIGRNVVMAGFSGIAGSAVIGDGVVIAGRVGVADHVTIGAGARLAAGSAVMRDVPPGETQGGYPSKPMREWLRELAWVTRQAQKRPGGKS